MVKRLVLEFSFVLSLSFDLQLTCELLTKEMCSHLLSHSTKVGVWLDENAG